MAVRALTLAKAHLASAVANGDGSNFYVCQKCHDEFHVIYGDRDPCAFCNDCKDAVLDVLAKAVIKAHRKARFP